MNGNRCYPVFIAFIRNHDKPVIVLANNYISAGRRINVSFG